MWLCHVGYDLKLLQSSCVSRFHLHCNNIPKDGLWPVSLSNGNLELHLESQNYDFQQNLLSQLCNSFQVFSFVSKMKIVVWQ